MNNSKEQYKRL